MRPRRKPKLNSQEQAEYDTELVRAVRDADAQWVRELLDAGADPNVRDERGDPVLYGAVRGVGAGFALSDAEAQIIAALIKAGADPKLDDVGARLCRLAWGAVCSALEAGDAHRLAQLLGVSKSTYIDASRH